MYSGIFSRLFSEKLGVTVAKIDKRHLRANSVPKPFYNDLLRIRFQIY